MYQYLRQYGLILLLLSMVMSPNFSAFTEAEQEVKRGHTGSGPAISDITTNQDVYPQGQIPRYSKFEITFQVDSSAENVQLPYDAEPPPGIEPGVGVSVDALFSPDNWKTTYTQPAFLYQEFLDEVKQGREWFYPTEETVWKVRFAPNIAGVWRYKLQARDSQGFFETLPASFQVVRSNSKGFVRAAKNDVRYFEFEDGTYFPGLGYNMNFDRVSWTNPVLDNIENFQIMSENGIQLARIWLTEWGIYGPSWNPWNSPDPALYNRQIPFSGLTFEEAFPGSQVSMRINAERNPCMFIGWWKALPAVKRNTDYRIGVQYKTAGIRGPRIAGRPFGFTVKTGKVPSGEGKACQDPGAGTTVTPHRDQNTPGWRILEGRLNSGDNDFLPNFYLVMENVHAGVAYVDYVWIQEDMGDGTYGPNIVSKPWMAHHLYMEQRNSYAFDKALELAEQHDIYLKVVLLEKNDWILSRINFKGEPIPDDPLCRDNDPGNDPEECPGSPWSYGNWRHMTAVRWLQQAWWRYVQARWGYSTSIHSWELLNEGDPGSGRHYTLADEFGKYMRQFSPNNHLATTSTWHSFPRDPFWANPAYPNVDYANYHLYITPDIDNFDDTALATYEMSMKIGAKQPGGANKPTMRGEIGFTAPGGSPGTELFARDKDAIWLHNFIWGGINAGGVLESYWYDKAHIYLKDRNGDYLFDYRSHYGSFYNFIHSIPLNNGNYREIRAEVSHEGLRVWGQIDPLNRRAHLWIQNQDHSWKNVIEDQTIAAINGAVNIYGFNRGAVYVVEWWDTYQTDPALQVLGVERLTARPDGSIQLQVNDLVSDFAVKISPGYRIYLPLNISSSPIID